MECRERARERDGARERERERARARAKPCILASGLGRSTAAQGVGVRVGGWGRGCDFARGRATAGYGHSIVNPTCPWTSCGDRRTRSHTPPLGSGPSPACPSNRHRTPSPERKWLSIGTGFSNLYTVCGRKTPSSSLTTPGHAYPPRVSGPASLLAMTRPFQTRIQSNIFDLVQYICRFVSLNKTRVLSCSFIPPEQCLLS